MILAIFSTVVFISILIVMGVMVYIQIKRTDPNRMDSSTKDDITTAQEFLVFEDIKDGMICLGGHQYRMVIECTSTNYNLKTQREKEMIEISFQRFVNSLTHPIAFYVQTKVIDNSKILESLKEEIERTVEQFPQLKQYGEAFLQEMTRLNEYIGNNKHKKKYIIVPYDEAANLQGHSDEEKFEYAKQQLFRRASIILEGLSNIGVKGHILDTKELAELVYSVYHRDNYSHAENITSSEFLALIVEGENKIQNLSYDARLDWILYETQMRIQTELMNEDIPDFFRNNAEICLEELNRLRDNIGGYFAQRADEENAITQEDMQRLFAPNEDAMRAKEVEKR